MAAGGPKTVPTARYPNLAKVTCRRKSRCGRRWSVNRTIGINRILTFAFKNWKKILFQTDKFSARSKIILQRSLPCCAVSATGNHDKKRGILGEEKLASRQHRVVVHVRLSQISASAIFRLKTNESYRRALHPYSNYHKIRGNNTLNCYDNKFFVIITIKS